jgi:membrane protein DedA with SNARE-associated domain
MAVDAVLPAGGEVTMLLAGALAAGALPGGRPVLFGTALATGWRTYVVLALAGTVGYLLGALAGWGLGRRAGRALLERHGRRLHLAPDTVERAERWLARRGSRAVLLGRLMPVVRSVISIPAGLLGCPLAPYAAMTFVGSGIWCFALAAAGWGVGSGYARLPGSLMPRRSATGHESARALSPAGRPGIPARTPPLTLARRR